MANTQQLSPGQVEKVLTKCVKQEIAQSNITSTRSGNKELGFLVKEVVSAPYDSEAHVRKVGTALGQKIAELSQQSNKQNLDAGVIRKLRYRKDWSAEFDIPVELPTEKGSKKTSKSTQTIVAASKPKVEETSAANPAELTAGEETSTAENPPQENTATDSANDSVMMETEEDVAMPNQSPENVSEAAITPETTAVSSQSAEADALLSEEADETTPSSEPAEAGLSEEAAATPEAAEAEVIEAVNSGAPGSGANTAAPVNPGAAALSNTEPAVSDDSK
ncbi:MAG: hypothetical protein WBB01_12295 [Phormidesmis sp.]